jgi:hypothetical protein
VASGGAGVPATTQPASPATTAAPGSAGGAPGASADARRQALVRQLAADPAIGPIYRRIAARQGVPMSEEVLNRLLAMRTDLARHPAVGEAILASLQSGDLTDPIAELVAPMERMLREESRAMDRDLAAAADSSAVPTGATAPRGAPAAGAATPVSFARIAGSLEVPLETMTAPSRATLAMRWSVREGLEYSIPVTLELVRTIPPPPGWDDGGIYRLSAPSGVFASTAGDRPIRFTDAGSSLEVAFGFRRPREAPPPTRGR